MTDHHNLITNTIITALGDPLQSTWRYKSAWDLNHEIPLIRCSPNVSCAHILFICICTGAAFRPGFAHMKDKNSFQPHVGAHVRRSCALSTTTTKPFGQSYGSSRPQLRSSPSCCSCGSLNGKRVRFSPQKMPEVPSGAAEVSRKRGAEPGALPEHVPERKKACWGILISQGRCSTVQDFSLGQKQFMVQGKGRHE